MASRTESQPNPDNNDQQECQLTFGFREHQDFLSYLGANKTGDGFEPTRSPSSTDAAPGTWEKVEVLAKRLEAGESLWNEEDRPIDLTKIQTSDSLLSLTPEEDFSWNCEDD